MRLTEKQKLEAMAMRFYQGMVWEPKAGDLYTTSRADLEVYEIVDVSNGIVTTRYTEGHIDGRAEWPVEQFQAEGFGPKRVWIPSFILENPNTI